MNLEILEVDEKIIEDMKRRIKESNENDNKELVSVFDWIDDSSYNVRK